MNFALVQFVEGFSKLPFFSLKVCAIFAPDDSRSSSTRTRAFMKEDMSRLCATSMWTARDVSHVKRHP